MAQTVEQPFQDVPRQQKLERLIVLLGKVVKDETYITQTFAARVISALRDTSMRRAATEAINLTIREDQIVRLLLRGRTNREIVLALKISEKTVKHYMTVLMQKMQVRSRIEVVLAAQKFGEVGGGSSATAPHTH